MSWRNKPLRIEQIGEEFKVDKTHMSEDGADLVDELIEKIYDQEQEIERLEEENNNLQNQVDAIS